MGNLPILVLSGLDFLKHVPALHLIRTEGLFLLCFEYIKFEVLVKLEISNGALDICLELRKPSGWQT